MSLAERRPILWIFFRGAFIVVAMAPVMALIDRMQSLTFVLLASAAGGLTMMIVSWRFVVKSGYLSASRERNRTNRK